MLTVLTGVDRSESSESSHAARGRTGRLRGDCRAVAVGLAAGVGVGIRLGRLGDVELAERDAGDGVVDRRGALLEPGLDLGDGRAELRIATGRSPGASVTAPVTSAVAKLVPSTVAVPESPDGAVNPSPGAAMVVAEEPPIAVPNRWALGSRLPERSVAVTLIVPATIAANPSPCWPLKLLPVAAMTGMFIAVSWPINWVTCWPAPPSLANQFWA